MAFDHQFTEMYLLTGRVAELLRGCGVVEGVWTQGQQQDVTNGWQQQEQLLVKSFLRRETSDASSGRRQRSRRSTQDLPETERTGEASDEGGERRHQYVVKASI